jgi:hypothetical protein
MKISEERDELVAFTLRAPSSLIRRVDAIARRDGVTRADVLRIALRSGLIAGPRSGFLQSVDEDISKG